MLSIEERTKRNEYRYWIIIKKKDIWWRYRYFKREIKNYTSTQLFQLLTIDNLKHVCLCEVKENTDQSHDLWDAR